MGDAEIPCPDPIIPGGEMTRRLLSMTARTIPSRCAPRRWPHALASATGLCLMAAKVWAAPIPVNNPSFELLPAGGLPNGCGAGCSYNEDFIPGWINTPFAGLGLSSGQFRPGTNTGNTTYFNSLSDGPTSAYTSNGCIEQTVGVALQPGVTYTLVVDVGWRNDVGPTGVPRLRVNDIYYDGIGTPVHGGWSAFTVAYVGRAQDAGSAITICLNSVSLQGNFDNVRLTDSDASTGVETETLTPLLQLQARPNPFGAVTRVHFSLTRRSPVVLRVFDLSGRAVRTLLQAVTLEPGAHEATWDGLDDAGVRLGSGLYFLRIETGETSRVERVLLVR